MNIDQVLAAEIPEGPYKLAMEKIYQDAEHFSAASFYTPAEHVGLVASLCAAFEALYELTSEKVLCLIDGELYVRHDDIDQVLLREFKEKGRAEAIKEVLAILENLPVTDVFGDKWYSVIARDKAVERIRALEVPSEQA